MDDGGDLQRQRESLAVLGLLEGATEEEMKAAYRRAVGEHHPDRYITPEEREHHGKITVNLNQAKAVLGF